MPDPSSPCGWAITETTLKAISGVPARSAGDLRPSSTPLDTLAIQAWLGVVSPRPAMPYVLWLATPTPCQPGWGWPFAEPLYTNFTMNSERETNACLILFSIVSFLPLSRRRHQCRQVWQHRTSSGCQRRASGGRRSPAPIRGRHQQTR
jgi:hypothetical protein